MNDFDYVQASDVASALHSMQSRDSSRFLAGGTNLIDLMREGITRAEQVIDITRLPLDRIEARSDGGLRIGAVVRNSHLAAHPDIRGRYRLLSEALLNGASGQLRNMATTGGNLMQRTRCPYFYDVAARCNKRAPGSGCDAIDGFNRTHAILGASNHCIATHPSDMCVALLALDATVNLSGIEGERSIPMREFHRLPGDRPDVDTEIRPGELITSVDLPGASADLPSSYRKVRDRASYAFALVAVATALKINDGRIAEVRIALGGVAHKPWRATIAEQMLSGEVPSSHLFAEAATAELATAEPQRHNAFKIPLATRTIVAELERLAELQGRR